MTKPPKNRISLPRNSHRPKRPAMRCCCSDANGSAGRGSQASVELVIGVGLARRARLLLEVVRRRRRFAQPFQTGGAPGIAPRPLAEPQRPQQIERRKKIRERQDRGAGRRQHLDRKSVVEGTSVSVSVDLVGRRIIINKNIITYSYI